MSRMPLIVKENETADPLHVAFFRRPRIVLEAHGLLDLVQQARRRWPGNFSQCALQEAGVQEFQRAVGGRNRGQRVLFGFRDMLQVDFNFAASHFLWMPFAVKKDESPAPIDHRLAILLGVPVPKDRFLELRQEWG
jgi:hypothetical protein